MTNKDASSSKIRGIINYVFIKSDIRIMETKRQQKVSSLLQREFGTLFLRHSKQWLGIPFATVSRVKVTPDLSLAKVYLTFLNEPDPQKILQKLRSHGGEIRHQMAKALKNDFRKLPEFAFYYDDSLDYAEHMDELFRSLNTNKEEGDENEGQEEKE